MDPKQPNREEELRAVFSRSLQAIHFAFVSGYQLSEEEATEAREVLYDWFHRLSYRPGASSARVEVLGDTFRLMTGACQLGQELQLWKLHGAPCRDDELKKILARDPRQVALQLLSKLIGGNE